MHIHGHSRLSTMWYIIPPQVSGGVLYFHVGCPCVCPSPLMGTYWVGYLLSTCSLFRIGVHRTTQIILTYCWLFCILLGRNFVWEKTKENITVRTSVCPSVRSLYVRPSVRTSFPFDSLSIHERISFKFCICICTNNVSLGIVNWQISIIYHRVTALVNVQKNVFWPLVPLLFGVS